MSLHSPCPQTMAFRTASTNQPTCKVGNQRQASLYPAKTLVHLPWQLASPTFMHEVATCKPSWPPLSHSTVPSSHLNEGPVTSFCTSYGPSCQLVFSSKSPPAKSSENHAQAFPFSRCIAKAWPPPSSLTPRHNWPSTTLLPSFTSHRMHASCFFCACRHSAALCQPRRTSHPGFLSFRIVQSQAAPHDYLEGPYSCCQCTAAATLREKLPSRL